MLPRLRRAVETLTPGYFALVMGSGMISVGMRAEFPGTPSAASG